MWESFCTTRSRSDRQNVWPRLETERGTTVKMWVIIKTTGPVNRIICRSDIIWTNRRSEGCWELPEVTADFYHSPNPHPSPLTRPADATCSHLFSRWGTIHLCALHWLKPSTHDTIPPPFCGFLVWSLVPALWIKPSSTLSPMFCWIRKKTSVAR